MRSLIDLNRVAVLYTCIGLCRYCKIIEYEEEEMVTLEHAKQHPNFFIPLITQKTPH